MRKAAAKAAARGRPQLVDGRVVTQIELLLEVRVLEVAKTFIDNNPDLGLDLGKLCSRLLSDFLKSKGYYADEEEYNYAIAQEVVKCLPAITTGTLPPERKKRILQIVELLWLEEAERRHDNR